MVFHRFLKRFYDPRDTVSFVCSALYYRPQRSCGKVMFSQASVILFTGRQTPPPWADTPLADTPGRHPPPSQTPPWTDTIPGQTPPYADTTPPPLSTEMATAVDGMHPTGMHSYDFIISQF